MFLAACGGEGSGGSDDPVPENRFPQAVFTANPVMGNAPLMVNFDASSSSDPDGDTLAYAWDFGDNTTLNGQEQPSHTYTVAGNYSARLTVTDANGGSDSIPINITVHPASGTVTVPDVVNQTQANATTAITSAGLTVGNVTNQNSDTIASGNIISQDPAAGHSVALATAVDIVVSLGPAVVTVIVPDMVGMTQAAGEAAITAAGLVVGVVTNESHPSIAAGDIISQSPASGNTVAQNSAVNLVVSLGAATGAVPDLVGNSQPTAQSLVIAAGFQVGSITTAASAVVAYGRVVSQEPTGGTTLPPDSAVHFVVSLGSETSLPPDPNTVAPPLDQTVPTGMFDSVRFLYAGDSPIQVGMAPDTIDSGRVAVLKGTVFSRDGNPMPGVTVSVLNHPEYGCTVSRADGMYDLVVNGGGMVKLTYAKAGFMTAQRQVEADWLAWAWLPDVALVPLDTAVTPIDFSTPMQVARGTTETDSDGSRTATLLFPEGTQAELVMPDGTLQPAPELNVRMTEYTVGDNGRMAMPAELPPASAYTYCVELSADEAIAAGAHSVNFDRPVVFHLENFLDVPNGLIIPVGFYNRQTGQWQAEENGLVIEIISETDGKADLDVNTTSGIDNGTALVALGITDMERQRLAELYEPGQSLWRAALTHFSPIDHNLNDSPPEDAEPPDVPEPDDDDDGDDNDPCEGRDFSTIAYQNQSLGETIPVPGTPFTLNYNTNRVHTERGFSLKFKASGDSLPATVQKIYVRIYVAGRKFVDTLQPTPNQEYTFVWDGKDVYGRRVQGETSILITVGYQYPAVITAGETQARIFGRLLSSAENTTLTRHEGPRGPYYIVWRNWTGKIGKWLPEYLGFGGWSINVQHAYSSLSNLLYRGDGRQYHARRFGSVIDSVVDISKEPMGGETLFAEFLYARDLAVTPDGSIYVSEGHTKDSSSSHGSTISKIDPQGNVSIIAGIEGEYGFNGDGGPAIETILNCPTALAMGHDGSLYFYDWGNSCVRKIDSDGNIQTVLGNGLASWNISDEIGETLPALEVSLGEIGGMAVGSDGALYFSDKMNYVVRAMGTDGYVTFIAGNGIDGAMTDGVPAIESRLPSPKLLAVGPDDAIYFTTQSSNVTRVGLDGLIKRVAGDPNAVMFSEGAQADTTQFRGSNGIAVDSAGNIYVGVLAAYPSGQSHVRMVRPDGIAVNFAGSNNVIDQSDYGECNYFNKPCDNGSTALDARLRRMLGVVLGANNQIYFLDEGPTSYISNVRVIHPPSAKVSLDTQFVLSHNGREIYEFNSVGRHLRTIDAYSQTSIYTFGYDDQGLGLLVSIEDRHGNTTEIERNGSGDPLAIVSPHGLRTALSLGADDYLAAIDNQAGESISMVYDSQGLLEEFIDAKGGQHVYTYDAKGYLLEDRGPSGDRILLEASVRTKTDLQITATSPLGHPTEYRIQRTDIGDSIREKFNPNGAVTTAYVNRDGSRQVEYPNGVSVSQTIQGEGRFGMMAPLIQDFSIFLPSGMQMDMAMERSVALQDSHDILSLDSISETLTVNGKRYVHLYDFDLQQSLLTLPEGQQQTVTFNDKGKIQQVDLSQDLEPIEYSYADNGRLTRVQQGDRFWSYTHNQMGLLDSYEDALGTRNTYSYDPIGRVASVSLPSGRSYRFTYDAAGNLVETQMPNGAEHLNTHTYFDAMASYTPPLAVSSYSMTYDADRIIESQTLPSGDAILFDYDEGGNIQEIAFPEAVIAFSYAGTPASCCSGGGAASMTRTPTTGGDIQTIAFDYDGFLPTGATWSGTAVGQYLYQYNADFFMTQITFDGTENTALTYDNNGETTGWGPFTYVRSNRTGFVNSVTDSNVAVNYTYNSYGEMESRTHTVNGTPVYTLGLTHDNTGMVIQKTETVAGVTETFVYGYDEDGRLLSVHKDGNLAEAYEYDLNGNRTVRTLGNGNPENSTYDLQDRIDLSGAIDYAVNDNGNVTGRAADTFTYSTRGELMQAVIDGTTTITYAYDGLGRRVARTEASGTYQYLYGNPVDVNQVTHIRAPSGEVTTHYYDEFGLLYAISRSAMTYYVACDQVGSPRVVSDSTGIVVKKMSYDSFGNLTEDTQPGFDLQIGFGGGVVDTATGLVHFGFRDYDPAAGRWMARDPLLFKGGSGNLYIYAQNNPINLRDPSGLLCLGLSGYAGIGVGSTICVTREGISRCDELGLGVGVNANLDLFGDLAEERFYIHAEASASAGPFQLGYEADVGECGFDHGPKCQVAMIDCSDGSLDLDYDTRSLRDLSRGLIKGGASARVNFVNCNVLRW